MGPTAGNKKLIGMYVHQHWPYNHPYAARMWTCEDWRGYLDGLHRLGFNLVAIWPMLETMPDPLTPSDRANLERTRRVIDMAHDEFDMKVCICLCPNVAAIDEAAARVPCEWRHFFYSDTRVDPADSEAMDAMMAHRERLLAPLAQTDAVSIIDSDPGGYPGSTNSEFVDLFVRHRQLLDKLRPGGISLIYWIHAGWPAYSTFYATGKFAFGTTEEFAEAISLIQDRNPEPWGLATGNLELARQLGVASGVISLNYGAIEGEPSFPMTNFGGDAAYNAGRKMGPRGVVGNAQTHCVQLPNTFAFARGARGLSLTDEDYVHFADDLLVGRGKLIVSAWQALAKSDSDRMREVAGQLAALVGETLEPGPLEGFLFGNPNRFVVDLYVMLRTRAAFEDFMCASQKELSIFGLFAEFVEWVERWQLVHGYQNRWSWPGLADALKKLEAPSLQAFYSERHKGNTPFDQVKMNYYRTETETLRLIRAMKRAVWELDPHYPDSSTGLAPERGSGAIQ